MVGREYIPSVILGTSTIACLIGANILNRKQQASLISAYALIDESFKKYKKATKTVYGDDADTKIKSEIAKSTYVSCTGHSLYSPDLDYSDDKMLFYDMISSRYFRASIPAVINAQYHINRNLQLRGYVSINEFYEFIGIEQVDGGDDFGWNIDELISDNIMWLDFNNDYTVMDDGLECCIISAIYEPILLLDT